MSAPIISGEAETRVQETADDAAVSKLSAVAHGYYHDPFLSLFVRKYQRRAPLINRGYFARVAAIELILRRFVAIARRTGDGRSQVVSLGAGMDTSFFRSYTEGHAPTVYFELDFPEVTARKAAIIRKHEVLQKCVAGKHVAAAEVANLGASAAAAPSPTAATTSPTAATAGSTTAAMPHAASDAAAKLAEDVKYVPSATGGCDIAAKQYRLVTADLRDVAACQAALIAAGIEASVPTLLLSECVLVYLEPEESCAIIAWAARTFPRSVFVTYEQIRPHDAFGQVMARNMEERGYSLRGLHAFPDIASQTARYRELGFGACTVADMNDVYYRLLPRSEVARIERLELFDEVEEWHLMSAHYSIAVAVNEVSSVPQRKHGKHGKQVKDATGFVGAAVAQGAAAAAAATSLPSGGSSSDMPAPAPKARKLAQEALSPKELAAAVVHAHESSVENSRVGRSPSRSRSQSRSRGMSGAADSDADLAAPAAHSSLAPVAGPAASTPEARGARLMRSSSVDSASTAVTQASVVLDTARAVDFAAIAEAEDEMEHARHVREAVGIDVMRTTGESGGAMRKHSGGGAGGIGGSAHGYSTPSRDGSGSTPSRSPFPAAVEGSRQHITSAASTEGYDTGSEAEGRGPQSSAAVSLADMLFPDWNKTAREASRERHG